MDDCERVHQLWKQGRYMEALTEAWNLSPLYRYPTLHRDDMTLRELVFRACQAAVEQAWQGAGEHAQQWVTGRLDAFPPPPALIDHDDGGDDTWCQWCQSYRERMIRTHLLCARVALTEQWTSGTVSTDDLRPIADETNFPRGFLHDVVEVLLPEKLRSGQHQPVRTLSLMSLLVDTAQDEGVVANLTLEWMPDGSGALYPAPEQAFVVRDIDFRQAEENAHAYIQERERVWPKDQDVRWRLERRDGKPFPPALIGNSLGAAFALGLAKLFIDE